MVTNIDKARQWASRSPEKHLYHLLLEENEEHIRAALQQYRFEEDEISNLIRLCSLAKRSDYPSFQKHLLGEVRNQSDAFPEIFNPDWRPTSQQHTRSVAAYKTLLSKKRVALVGPSWSIQESGQGPIIDSYDMVVRLNNMWPINEPDVVDLGRRMDVIYRACTNINPLDLQDFENTRFVCWQLGAASPALRAKCQAMGIPDLEVSSIYDELVDQIGTFPNTGTVAIHHLLSIDIKQLFIAGITFYREPYMDSYPGVGIKKFNEEFYKHQPTDLWLHEFEPQLRWFKQLAHADFRIRVDAALARILNEAD